MSVLVVGVSHRSAPLEVLEELARDADGVSKLLADVCATDHVHEATVLATCNRLEVYAQVDRFHGSVEAISLLMCSGSQRRPWSYVPHLYVHYDDRAVGHLFRVAAGLDSLVVGESQILGQTRAALRLGQDAGAVGPTLNTLFQQALRVGKRAHAETDIDRRAPSLVSAALDRCVQHLGTLEGRRALVVGAGTMASLAVSTLVRSGVQDVAVVNRTGARADRVAVEHGVRARPWPALDEELRRAEVVVSCTGSPGLVLHEAQVAAAREGVSHPLAVVDLALPHDVDPAVGRLPGVSLVGLRRLTQELGGDPEGTADGDVGAVSRIVAEEIALFAVARRQASVTPTLVALRSMASGVVDAEVRRLLSRVPDLDEAARAEVETTVRRVADKLLHQPTVRVKQLAGASGAVSYAAALRELFALDPEAVEAVTRAEDTR